MGPKEEPAPPAVDDEAKNPAKLKPDPLPTFVFDLIVNRVVSHEMEFSDPTKLEITANFFKTTIPLTPSMINVDEFKNNAGLQFQKDPKEVRKDVGSCGISFTVSYDKKTIGTGQASFPPPLVDTIDKEMPEFLHSDSIRLSRGTEVTGKLDFQCRMVILCLTE